MRSLGSRQGASISVASEFFGQKSLTVSSSADQRSWARVVGDDGPVCRFKGVCALPLQTSQFSYDGVLEGGKWTDSIVGVGSMDVVCKEVAVVTLCVGVAKGRSIGQHEGEIHAGGDVCAGDGNDRDC